MALQGMFDPASYPVTDEIHNTTLSLPISSYHSPEDIARVINAVNHFPAGES
jgi:dTDP-4-amino-4,6-dideoxygalactose transaminase